MKPFNLEEAKAGKPVQTRDGRDVEILTFDLRGGNSMLAIIKAENHDYVATYAESGYYLNPMYEDKYDLFMKTEKKEGWVAVLKDGKLSFNIYATKEEAESIFVKDSDFVAVAKIEWEE